MKKNILLSLLVVSFVSPMLVQAGDCPYSGAGNFVCYCDDGHKEYHYDIDSFNEAKDNPTSCCYYKPITKPIIHKAGETQTANNEIKVISPPIEKKEPQISSEKPKKRNLKINQVQVMDFLPLKLQYIWNYFEKNDNLYRTIG